MGSNEHNANMKIIKTITSRKDDTQVQRSFFYLSKKYDDDGKKERKERTNEIGVNKVRLKAVWRAFKCF